MAGSCCCSCSAMATSSALTLSQWSTRLQDASRRLSSSTAGRGTSELRSGLSLKGRGGARSVVRVRADSSSEVIKSKGLARDGPGQGGQWLSSTTRHVRLYIGVADPVTKAMDQSQLDKITLMLDPDHEFVWPEESVQKVYRYFAELIDHYEGADCTEYTLRLIGSDIEHYIRKLLLANEIKYNLDARTLNFSMGLPRYDPAALGLDEESG